MEHRIRHLQAPDIAMYKGLLSMFGKAFEDSQAYASAVPGDARIAEILGNRDFIALAALDENGETVIGGLAAYVLQKFEQDRREIYIYDLAVDEAFRRRGIARALINELRRVARERDAYVIYVQADPGDDPAIQLYESMGTREDVHHFDILP